ncbi:hypothetical protein TRSC58_04780 [Trypanosoma rangeli SC58]|uniref:Uncharacterized protein n=1 Tax=Trypanosoma rangeli SC58 TaxID=429131 RepID=A0A061IXY5_TRYRA|nr:hypothetical protein TRSC58_04780 [Trypanosoma rangeli SC58]
MTIRCLTRRRAQWAPIALTVPVRLLRRKLSPDRTRDEEIQDRQNAFVWHEKHTFRPHQHFTYDPSSWSRPLEEKMKAKRKLSLVDRLRVLEEREIEAASAIEATKEPKELKECTEDLDYFYSIQETENTAVSLQAQMERLNVLHVLLTAPRHLDTPLAKVERLRQEYRELLRRVFERARLAVVDETMTFDALLYSWFLLLQGAQPLLEALTEGQSHAGDRLHDGIVTMRDALDKPLLHAMEYINAKHNVELILEGWVELFDLVTHPFTRQGQKLRESKSEPCHAFATVAEQLEQKVMDRTMTALAERMITDDGTELLDAQHMCALLRSMARSSCVMEESSLQRAALLTRKVGEGILATLKSVVAPSLRHSMRLFLLGSSAQRVAFNTDESIRGRYMPRPVVLDPCDPPSGVKNPVIAADEVLHATCAGIALLRQTVRASPVTRLKVVDAVDVLLLMLSYAPNYDLGIRNTATFVCEMMEGGVLGVDTGAVERHLHVVLLLSRLQFSTCNNQAVLCRLLFLLCSLAPPASCPELTLREWKRLYGTVMHQLLTSVHAAALSGHYTCGPNSPGTWEELLAFGKYNGVLPLALWYDACQRYFDGTNVPLSSTCARALLSLRTRCRYPGKGGFARRTAVYSKCASPLDFDSVQLLARLLHVVLDECVAAEDLINEASAWDMAHSAAGDDRALSALLLGAQKCVLERQTSKHAVMTFC